MYAIVATSLTPPSTVTTVLSYEGTAVVAFLFAMSLATGGVMVMKSDRDYLFTLPLSTRDLAISIFFSQFIAYGAAILFVLVYLAPGFSSPLLVIDVIGMALTVTSLGIIATSLRTRVRLFLSVALGCWTLLALVNIPYTPASAFNANLYTGTATLLLLTVATTAAAVRGLSRVELDMMKNLVRSTSSDIKSQVSYSGKSPIGAIYSMNLSTMSLAGRMNMAGTSRYVSRRVKTRWMVAAASVAAVAYLAATLYLVPPAPSAAGTDTLPAAIAVAIGLTLVSFFLSQSAITNERIWLSLTSLPAGTYFRHLIISRVVSLLMLLAPFAAVDVALFAIGYGGAMGALTVVAAVIPASYVLTILWTAYIAPIQVKGDDQLMAAQFSIRQFLTALPLIAVFLLVSVATVFPIVAAVGGLALFSLDAVLMLSGRFWGGVVTKLTASGFV